MVSAPVIDGDRRRTCDRLVVDVDELAADCPAGSEAKFDGLPFLDDRQFPESGRVSLGLNGQDQLARWDVPEREAAVGVGRRFGE